MDAIDESEPQSPRELLLRLVVQGAPAAKIQPLEEFFEASTDGIIYLLRCGDRVKIGFTNNFAARMRILKTSCPYPVELITSFLGNRAFEQFLHAMFADFRRHGEWFEDSGWFRSVILQFQLMK